MTTGVVGVALGRGVFVGGMGVLLGWRVAVGGGSVVVGVVLGLGGVGVGEAGGGTGVRVAPGVLLPAPGTYRR
jgi:hypothetical protein